MQLCKIWLHAEISFAAIVHVSRSLSRVGVTRAVSAAVAMAAQLASGSKSAPGIGRVSPMGNSCDTKQMLLGPVPCLPRCKVTTSMIRTKTCSAACSAKACCHADQSSVAPVHGTSDVKPRWLMWLPQTSLLHRPHCNGRTPESKAFPCCASSLARLHLMT